MDKKGILMAVGLAVAALYWITVMGPKPQPQTQVAETEDVGSQSEGTVKKEGEVNSLDTGQNPDRKDPAANPDKKDPATNPDKKDPATNPDRKDPQPVENSEEKFEPLPEKILKTEQLAMTVDPQRGVTEIELFSTHPDELALLPNLDICYDVT